MSPGSQSYPTSPRTSTLSYPTSPQANSQSSESVYLDAVQPEDRLSAADSQSVKSGEIRTGTSASSRASSRASASANDPQRDDRETSETPTFREGSIISAGRSATLSRSSSRASEVHQAGSEPAQRRYSLEEARLRGDAERRDVTGTGPSSLPDTLRCDARRVHEEREGSAAHTAVRTEEGQRRDRRSATVPERGPPSSSRRSSQASSSINYDVLQKDLDDIQTGLEALQTGDLSIRYLAVLKSVHMCMLPTFVHCHAPCV